MTFLITGGAGFIGSNLAEKLLQQGEQVICLDNFDDFYNTSIKRLNIAPSMKNPRYHLQEADIRDRSNLDRIFSSHKVDMVIHLAAKAGVRPSLLNPEIYYNVNVIGTLKLLEAMRKAGVGKMIFASSSAVYGNNIKVPFSENDPVDTPVSPYAASKIAGELLCHTYNHLYGFDIFCMRLFTVYGPRQRPEMAIHKFISKILKKQPIQLYGNGLTKRDYTFISDIIDGMLKAIQNLKGYEIINLGSARPIPLIDLVNKINVVLERKAIIEWNPVQAGDANCTFADISKAKKLLGYEPAYQLQNGLDIFLEWYRKRAG